MTTMRKVKNYVYFGLFPRNNIICQSVVQSTNLAHKQSPSLFMRSAAGGLQGTNIFQLLVQWWNPKQIIELKALGKLFFDESIKPAILKISISISWFISVRINKSISQNEIGKIILNSWIFGYGLDPRKMRFVIAWPIYFKKLQEESNQSNS